MHQIQTHKTFFNRGLRVGIVFFIGYLAGQWSDNANLVEAEQRETKPREAFLSGGERSEIVLQSMQKTLLSIDQRLVSIEKSTATMASRSLK